MKKLFVAIALFLSACAPSEQVIQTVIAQTQAAWTSIPTQTAYPTYTIYPTYTAIPVTNTPLYTPTITNTPLPTNTRPPTPDPLQKPRGDGIYLINVNIAAGVWKNNGTGDTCYWEVTSKTGELVSNHFGQAGGTAYLPPNGFQIEFERCGTWEFMSLP